MTSNVEPEEAAALMDAFDPAVAGAARDVSQRDFSVPQRLREASIIELQRVVETTLPQAEVELGKLLRGRMRLDVVSANEVNSEAMLAELSEPMALVRFDAGGHPAWVQWEIESAVEAVEQILGASEPTPASRELSPMERTVLRTIIEGVCQPLFERMGLQADGFEAVGQLKEAGDWRQAERRADPHRLGLELRLTTPAGASNLRFYVPVFDAQLTFASRAASLADAGAIPRHLASVEMAVTARLGAVDLPLSELLALEIGDVVPVGTMRGEAIEIHADNQLLGYGLLGSRGGRLALRLTDFDRSADQDAEPESPTAPQETQ